MKHQRVAMPQAVVWLFLSSALLLITSSHLAAAAVSNEALSVPPISKPNCPSKCGDVEIPYPFGIGDGCAAAGPGLAAFNITCNHSSSPPKPFAGDFEILDISVESAEMRIVSPVSHICFDSYNTTESGGNWNIELPSSFLVSKRRNKFTAIGCSTLAYFGGSARRNFLTGCISSCESLDDAAQDGKECAGLGCCQMGIPSDVYMIGVDWGYTTNPAWNYSPCSYAFVAQKGWYHFRLEDLTRRGNESFISSQVGTTLPVVLDWAITSDVSCQITREASGMSTITTNASACASAHSRCIKATQGNGYICKCSTGYQGNPYITDGCININECKLRKSNLTKYGKQYPCHSSSTCQDTPGDYKCKCKFWHRGDGKSDKGCQPRIPAYAVAIVATFVSVALACFAIVLLQRRKHRKSFSKNGGDILMAMGIGIFTESDLKRITNGYRKNIGGGYFGKVYKGTINGTQQVAVKRPHEKAEAPPLEEFRNEIIFQFRINHDNVVRLLGCCLETDVPILVFEYIPKGSLHEMLHGSAGKPPCALSLMERLDIAIGSAGALAYMHSHGERNHIHGDIKSANILLDGDLKPKVSDFGSSKLLSANRYVKGVPADMAYIDPVYHKTGYFTVKSDVYSFGVVLLELITRNMPRYGDSSLTIDFKKSFKDQGNGRKMYDSEMLSDVGSESQRYLECLDMVGALAIQCLKEEDVDERPDMDEVLKELEQAKSIASGGPRSEAS
ncbi:hypothetical protein EJB05_25735, partial [Eragrostis curvula]